MVVGSCVGCWFVCILVLILVLVCFVLFGVILFVLLFTGFQSCHVLLACFVLLPPVFQGSTTRLLHIISYLLFISCFQSSQVPLQGARLYFGQEGGRERERSEPSERLWEHLAVPVLGSPNGPRSGAAAVYFVLGPDRFPGPKTVPEFQKFLNFRLLKSEPRPMKN